LGLDLLAVLGAAVPLVLALGIAVLVGALSHLVLASSGNRLATEIGSTCALGAFVVLQTLFGAFSAALTLITVIAMIPLLVFELATGSRNDQDGLVLLDLYQSGDEVSEDVLCFRSGRNYSAIAALRIKSVVLSEELSKTKKNDEASLKRLRPLWEHKSESVAYALHVSIKRGLADLYLFVTGHSKQWNKAVGTVKEAVVLAQLWMQKMEFECDSVEGMDLRRVVALLELGGVQRTNNPHVVQCDSGLLGITTVESLGPEVDNSVGLLTKRLIERGVEGNVVISLSRASVPNQPRSLRFQHRSHNEKNPELTPKLQDHRHRELHKQIAEIEACEETGSFRVSLVVIYEGRTRGEIEKSSLVIDSILRSTLSQARPAKISASQMIQMRNHLLLRQVSNSKSALSGARLLCLLDFPTALPGLANHSIVPAFMVPKHDSVQGAINLGRIVVDGKTSSQWLRIPLSTLCNDVAIYGNPGSGKTNTAFHIVREVYESGVPFLVLSPAKTEWRALAEVVPDLRIFTAGDESVAPFRFSIFDVPPNASIQKHIEALTTCFIAAWPTEGILVEHITRVFRRAYRNAGWNAIENVRGKPILLDDLYRAMEEVVSELAYGSRMNTDFSGALKARFLSLLESDAFAAIVNTEHGIAIEGLIAAPTVIETRSLPESQATLLTGLILVSMTEYLEANSRLSEQELTHLLVLEEAHHLLKQVASLGLNEGHSAQQKAIDAIVNLLREARGLGLGMLIIDQLPGELAQTATKLPGVTVAHQLKDPRERALAGGQANLNEEQTHHIGHLGQGEAVVHRGLGSYPVLVCIPHILGELLPTMIFVDDVDVAERMRWFYDANPELAKYRLPSGTEWTPDPQILRNLEYIVEDDGFAEKRDRYLDPCSGLARTLIQRMLTKHHVLSTPTDIDRYTSLFLNYLQDTERRDLDA
jgi:DNA helicase HerA-like ATPase